MRLYDWEARLSAYISKVASSPFEYGVHDCALFAAGAVDAVAGFDPAAPWRGHYSTEAGGLKLVRRAGFESHVAVFRDLFPVISGMDRLAGDLVIVIEEGREIMGLTTGAVIYVLRTDGLGILPIGAASEYLAVR